MRRPIQILCVVAALVGAPGLDHASLRAQDAPRARAPRDTMMPLVRQRMDQLIRRRLGLTDAQAQRLAATTRRFEERRVALFGQERDARAALREHLESGDSTRGPQVAALLDRLLQVQRARLDLVEQEQRELAAFLTPIQRAQFLGLEEQMRARMESIRGRPLGPPPPGQRGLPGGRMPRPPEPTQPGA